MRKILIALFMLALGSFAFALDSITPGTFVKVGPFGGAAWWEVYVTSIKKTNGVLEIKFFTGRGFELVFNEVTKDSFVISHGNIKGRPDIEKSKNDVLVLMELN